MVSGRVAAQDSAASRLPCTCGAQFDDLVQRVKADYIGYRFALAARSRDSIAQMTALLRERANRTPNDSCVFALRAFTQWFRDGHLFVVEAPQIADSTVQRLTASAATIARSEADIRRDLARRASHLDPIEGIWYAEDGYRVGIIPDPRPQRHGFVAIVLSTTVAGWAPGQVKGEFVKRLDGSYTATLYIDNHSVRHPEGDIYRGVHSGVRIYKGLLLRMSPREWGKEYPIHRWDRGILNSRNPRAPTLLVRDNQTVVVSVPSHDGQYKAALDSLISAHRADILAADNLIIDLRGDEGGNEPTTASLEPFITSKVQRPPLAWEDDVPVVLSSPTNIAYFTLMKKDGWVPAHLTERMQLHPGAIVPFPDTLDNDPTSGTPAAADTAYQRPRRVAILIDRAIVSAGEAFILRVRRRAKVTLFGEPTAGVIDFQDVQLTDLRCAAGGLLVGYPMVAGSSLLPRGGLNNVGIPPDVPIAASVGDHVGFIVDYYHRHGSTRSH